MRQVWCSQKKNLKNKNVDRERIPGLPSEPSVVNHRGPQGGREAGKRAE